MEKLPKDPNASFFLTGGGRVAYFSMEVALDAAIPTYSGGLGVLAGDTIRAAADLSVPMVAVTMLYHKGYFRQTLSPTGKQKEEVVSWDVDSKLKKIGVFTEVEIEGRRVKVGAYCYPVVGATGSEVPVYFLDTNFSTNSEFDRSLTDSLYAGDERYRLAQELVLGMGGVRLLKALGHAPQTGAGGTKDISRYHMNEGHAALLTLALVEERTGVSGTTQLSTDDLLWLRERCVFTTHTPVPAGHDRFPLALVREMLGESWVQALEQWQVVENKALNMTLLAMEFARFVNGVAKRHGEVSEEMFKGCHQAKRIHVAAITNGVHGESWVGDSMARLFDKQVPLWRRDNSYLRYLCDVSATEIGAAHLEAKRGLLAEVTRRAQVKLDPAIFTIGFARRAAEYKRADLLFADLQRLEALARTQGRLQVLFGGKAHPKDLGGKALIENVHKAAAQLDPALVSVVYLANYDMELGRLLTSGVDLWLNTPLKPLEASGTSGMKAAMNGVPSLSTLDGWWVEGCFEGVTGWEIDDDKYARPDERPTSHSPVAVQSLYNKLEKAILPLYYQQPQKYDEVRRAAISLNGSFFTTHRMVQQYLWHAYR